MRKSATSNEEDLKLIKLIKNKKCNSSYNKLQEKHSNLFYSICNKYKTRINLDEVHKDKDFVMFKALSTFSAEKGAKFSTWLGNYTRYHCLNYIKNNYKYVITDDDKISHFFNSKSVDEYGEKKDVKNDLDHAFSILEKLSDKRIFKIFKLRYNDSGPKLTWKQIAKRFDLTPQTIINLHTKGRRAIKKKMSNNS